MSEFTPTSYYIERRLIRDNSLFSTTKLSSLANGFDIIARNAFYRASAVVQGYYNKELYVTLVIVEDGHKRVYRPTSLDVNSCGCEGVDIEKYVREIECE